MKKSYVSIDIKPLKRLGELYNLYQWHKQNVITRAEETMINLQPVKGWIEQRLGCPLKDKKILEVGPGQTLAQYYFFAKDNEVVGVDTDIVIIGLDPQAYLKMLRSNGLTRTVKTLGRNVLGFDRRYRSAMAEKLGVNKLPQPQIINADIGQTKFPDNYFDCVVSFSVFEHLAEPEKALTEITRLIKPGGVAYICVNLYTSDSGCHDPRIFSGNRGDLPYRAHLRPDYEDLVQPNSYLNKWSLSDWKELFDRMWSGWEYVPFGHDVAETQRQLAIARESKDLEQYSDEELLTEAFTAIWKKPS
jgi:SAM-dependent methyltransferase